MYLSELEIIGFKSFANKTGFRFSEGMTGFVGPNGCGKTNILDAIRWVLGEQKTSVLRSDVMENVIFNGSDKRKPLGMAEVSITLQNNKQKLPTEYTEVKITRRLFRNGESHYLINNSKCRLRDVTDLFMDTGMGPDSYSVIELKMVEAILSGKPEERRHLFEEAAGVTKYKARRKEASKKLESVQTDLLRVQDIVQEVEKNVGSLSRQASKTMRYNKLMAQHKELDLKLVHHEYDRLAAEEKELVANNTDAVAKKTELQESIDSSEKHLNELKDKLGALNREYQKARDLEVEIGNLIALKNREIAVINEKILSLGQNFERITKEIGSFGENREKLINLTVEAENKLKDTLDRKAASESGIEGLKIDRDTILSTLDELKEDANSKNEEIIRLRNSIDNLKSLAAKNRQRRETIESGISEADLEIEKINNSLGDLDIEAEATKKLIEENRINVGNAEKELRESQENQAKLGQAIEKMQEELAELKNSHGRKTAELDFYNSFIDADESVKFLIENEGWKPEGEKILLAEAVGADDEYRVAVEAALGEAAGYFVVDTRKEALAAFNFLKKNEKGKAVFICRESIPEIPPPGEPVIGEGIVGWLSEIVRVDPQLRNVLRAIIGKTLLVDVLQNAIDMVDFGIAEAAVTLDGELVTSKGIIKGGAIGETEGLSVGKKEILETLERELWDLNKIITELAEEYRLSRSNYNLIDLNKLNENLRNLENNESKLQNRINEINYKKQNLINQKSLNESNLSRINEEMLELEKEVESGEYEIDSQTEALEILQEEFQTLINDVRSYEKEFDEKDESVRAAERIIYQLDSESKSLEKDIKHYNDELKSLTERNENAQNELFEIETAKKEYETKTTEYAGELEGLNNQSGQALSASEYIEEEINSVQEQITTHSNDLVSQRRNYERFTDSIHQYDIKLNEYRSLRNSLIIRAKENFELELEEVVFEPDPEFSLEDTKYELKNIKEKLMAIGNVNFMALEDYERESRRLDFYEKQIKDLVDSEKTLQETINEINQTAEIKFLDTYEQVNKNFTMLFKKLFGDEGEARLELAEGNPLECDIEIIAKPPNKRPNSIEALSSGEKTLTAIALLFGIYLVKPSPFCILDEVDAPLDDANIDKYLNLIKEFSIETQFMIVTHNKRTMASADTLYGITMQEEGLTKVVSVRMAPEIAG